MNTYKDMIYDSKNTKRCCNEILFADNNLVPLEKHLKDYYNDGYPLIRAIQFKKQFKKEMLRLYELSDALQVDLLSDHEWDINTKFPLFGSDVIQVY